MRGRNLVGDTEDVPPTSLHGEGHNMPSFPHFFLLRFVFGEVSKLNVTFVTFCLKTFSC